MSMPSASIAALVSADVHAACACARVESLLDHDEARIVLCAPRTEAAYAGGDLQRVVVSPSSDVVVGDPAVAEHGCHGFPVVR